MVDSPSTAILNINTSPPVSISGSPQGNGKYLFPSSGIIGYGVFDFDVEVNNGSYSFTLGRGSITIYNDV